MGDAVLLLRACRNEMSAKCYATGSLFAVPEAALHHAPAPHPTEHVAREGAFTSQPLRARGHLSATAAGAQGYAKAKDRVPGHLLTFCSRAFE